MGRPRNRVNSALRGTNLYRTVSKGQTYYRWRNPNPGPGEQREFSLGRISQSEAIEAAHHLNQAVRQSNSTVERVMARIKDSGPTLADVLADYDAKVLQRPRFNGKYFAKSTIDNRRSKIEATRRRLGKRPIRAIEPQEIKTFIDTFSSAQAKSYREFFSVIFQYAQTEFFRKDNPMEEVPKYRHARKRGRLTPAGFDAIFHHPECPVWLKNAMELSRITGLARNELANLRRDAIHDGYLHVTRAKTGAKISFHIGDRLRAVIDRCNDGVASPFLIHRQNAKNMSAHDRKGVEHWSQLRPHNLSQHFATVRDQCEYFRAMPEGERPTFHEIRALGAIEYEAAGYSIEDIRRMLGHRNQQETQRYLADHKEHWIDASTM